MLLGDTLYVGANDGYLYALDAATGELKWKHETLDKIVGSANWMQSLDGKATWVLVGSYDNHLYCLDSQTGKEVWKYETTSYINGTPAVDDGLVVFGGCDSILHGVSVKEAEPKSQVQIEFDGYVAGSVALHDHHAYVGHFGNKFVAADLTSEKIVWDYAKRRFPFGGSPAVTDRLVVFGGHDKHVHCVKREDGEEVWSFRTRGNVDSSPVVVGDKVVVGSEDGTLYMLRLAKEQEVWAFEIGQAILSSPAVADGRVVIGAEDGYVYCFAGE
jgi:outer membrane protein assembly factor BamB